MKKIDITEMAKYMDAAWGIPNLNLMFVGETGIGKTQMVEQFAANHDAFLVTKDLSQLEPTEALGIPVECKRTFQGKEYASTTQAIPDWVFQLAESKKAILFLDEFLGANPENMKPFLNFLTTKRVDDLDLSHVLVISATNVERYTYTPADNVMSRFCMFQVENRKLEQYLTKKYKNTVVPVEELDGYDHLGHEIFQDRTLKPRCQETLCELMQRGNMDLVPDFYEGWTNKRMPVIFHTNPKVNPLVAAVVSYDTANKRYEISEDGMRTLAGSVVSAYPRAKNFKKIGDGFVRSKMFDVDANAAVKMMDEIYQERSAAKAQNRTAKVEF